MGVDIHLHIINKEGKMIAADIFEGRNYEWFGQLKNEDPGLEFPCRLGVPENIPEEIKKDLEDVDYYGFYHISVDKYVNWFEKFRPDKDAGWITTYEKYLYEQKKIIPDISKKYLYPDDVLADYHFVEITNEYNNFYWLYKKIFGICETDIDEFLKNYIIVYYFDC